MHLAVDSHGMPVRLLVTEGTVADCTQALPLIEGISAECLLADKAYDTNEIVAAALELGMNPVIPPKSNRREKREYDRALYKLRHLVENGFLDFKQWRGVATRYAKNSLSYLAVCQIRAMVIWTKLKLKCAYCRMALAVATGWAAKANGRTLETLRSLTLSGNAHPTLALV